MCEVTVTPPVTAGSPPARLTRTHTRPLVAQRQVAVALDWAFEPPVTSVALAAACELVAPGAHRAGADALARLGAGRRPPAFVAGAVPVARVAVAMAGALAGVLAQRTPAVGVAGALTCDGVTSAVGVAPTHLATV